MAKHKLIKKIKKRRQIDKRYHTPAQLERKRARMHIILYGVAEQRQRRP